MDKHASYMSRMSTKGMVRIHPIIPVEAQEDIFNLCGLARAVRELSLPYNLEDLFQIVPAIRGVEKPADTRKHIQFYAKFLPQQKHKKNPFK